MGKYMWKAVEILADGDVSLDDLPDWWFYFRAFKRRRCGFSRFYCLPPLERLPGWLRRELEIAGLAASVTGAERVPGGGWRIWLFADKHETMAGCWVRPSPWKIVQKEP